MALFLTMLSTITFVIASKIDFESRIVNGEPISASEYPWMVSLRQEVQWTSWWKQQNQFCGGALIEITPPIILTAAHCMDMWSYNETDNTTRDSHGNINKLYADINRTYDLIDTNNDTYWTLNISISDIHIHPKWTGELFVGYDIALIILNDFDFNTSNINIDTDYYKTLLPELYTGDHLGFEFTAIGYGDLVDSGESSPRLKSTTLNYVNKEVCGDYLVNRTILNYYNVTHPDLSDEELKEIGVTRKEFKDNVGLWTDYVETTAIYEDAIICVLGNNTDLCQGDSGGPMVQFNTITNKSDIVGVASYVMGECNDGFPSGYTYVAKYDYWIRKTISFEGFGITSDPTPSPTKAPHMDTDEGYMCYSGIVNIVTVVLVLMYLMYI